MLRLASSLSLLAVAVPLVACGGGGGEEDPIPDGRLQPDAGIADARIDQPTGVISNLRNLDWQAKAGTPAGFSIVSSNFVQERIGTAVYQHWYAEIRNTGTSTLCIPKVTLDFQDRSGVTLVSLLSYPDTEPYDTGSTVSSTCLAPGKTAPLWTIENPSSEVVLANITRAVWSVDGLERASARPHPLAPTITSNVFERNTGYWAVQGSLRASGGAIRNIGYDAYPVGPEGWIVDDLIDTNLGSLTQGASWSFETTSYKGARFSRYLEAVSFISGVAVASVAPVDAAIASESAAQRAARDARKALRAQRDAGAATLR